MTEPKILAQDFAGLTGFHLRLAQPKDMEEFIDTGLETCAFMYGRPGVSREVIKRNFSAFVEEFAADKESRIYIVTTPEGGLAAQMWLHETRNRFNGLRETWIWDLTVKKEYQKKGIGRSLLKFAKKTANDHHELWLLVADNNHEAIRMYLSEGLHNLGRLMGIKAPDSGSSGPGSTQSSKLPMDTVTLEYGCLSRLEADDIPELYNLWEIAELPARTHGRDRTDRLSRFLRSSPLPSWCIRQEGKMIGAVINSVDGRKGWIERLAVHPEHRRTGLAKALIAASLHSLKESGALVIGALIESENTASRRLFESCRFVYDPNVCYYTVRESPDS